MKRIYIECDYDSSYGKFWKNLGRVIRDRREFLKDPTSFDLVGFTGGEDISPSLYGHRNLASQHSPARDSREVETFNIALKHGLPMTGICRGIQLLSSLLGGTMVQHLRKSHSRAGGHACLTEDGQEFEVTSAHHQMIVPTAEGQILAWAEHRLREEDCVYDGKLPENVLFADLTGANKDRMVTIPEAVAYPKLKIFGVQFHPEWMEVEGEGCQWTLQKTREICWGEKKAKTA